MAQSGKIAEVLFENALETYEHQMQMLDLVDVFNPNSGDMQNAGDVVWRPTQQHAPIIEGWEIGGQETDIIQETYPAVLGDPKNDFIAQRVDQLRDMQFWEERGKESGKKQATTLNSNIASLIANTGSLFYRSDTASGYEFVAEAQAVMNERQLPSEDMRCMVLNDRDNLAYSSDLAGRQTLQGRPADTWKTGQIGSNVAEFDIYTGSFLPNLAGGAVVATTTTADVSDKPEGGSVAPITHIVTNVDYRISSAIPVVDSSTYTVGDVVTFSNGGIPVESVGLADKNASGQPMTFRVVAIPDGLNIQVFPKPIAVDDGLLTVLEQAYGNINTQILTGATVDQVNVDANPKTNIFWCKPSIEVTSGDAPINLLSEFGGMKVVSSTMSNGQKMYMAYDGDIDNLSFKCRLFTWYSVTNKNPSANGVGIRF